VTWQLVKGRLRPVRDNALFIDATRGMAMFFVFLAHLATSCLNSDSAQAGWQLVRYGTGKIASPTFMLATVRCWASCSYTEATIFAGSA
jgi:hypothetical protein